MEMLAIRTVLAVLGLIVSARTVVHVPALGPEPALGVVALAVLLLAVAGVLLAAGVLTREGLRLRPRAVAL